MRLIICFLVCLSGVVSPLFSQEGNGKKIYADYHGVRYTRDFDGKLGRWEMHADTRKSKTGRETLCYNADFIDESGRNDIAAVAYPQVGMQSNMDPHYIEYQILSAKSAKIDGFFIEWGFMQHENDLLLRAMQPIAAKYGFEIGVNWCDGWLYYNWITKYYPEIDTREEKTEHYVKSYQYLIDSVFTGETAPMVDGRPVFYLFGPGAKHDEYKWVLSQLELPEGMKQPRALRRWADWGELRDDKYIPVTQSDDISKWTELDAIPTAWLPARVRPMDSIYPNYDYYATADDVIEFMKPFRDSIWMSDYPKYDVKSGFAMPSMDNSGCAGWGRGHFFTIPRDNGETYKRMWEFNMASKDSLDMMFIASWSDYTEGHEIEPTIENGDRELRTTLKYASIFKSEVEDDRGIELPLRLFKLRKRSQFMGDMRKFVKSIKPIDAKLDRSAVLISEGEYGGAIELLSEADGELKELESDLKSNDVVVTEDELRFSLNMFGDSYHVTNELKLYLSDATMYELIASRSYTGYLEFEYYDEGKERIRIYSPTDREPKALFGTVADFRTDNTNGWKKARVKLITDNIEYKSNSFSFLIKGKVRVKNFKIDYTTYK